MAFLLQNSEIWMAQHWICLVAETLFLSHADRGRAQDDVGLMGETDVRSSAERGAVN